MKKLGFQFEETMTGTYTRTGDGQDSGGFRFRARVTAASALRHLRDGMAKLEGTLDMDGFADDVPLSGTIEIRPLFKKIIRYEFGFTANDGNPYQFAGQKNIRFDELVPTMTTLSGSITDARDGTEVARATCRFDVKGDLIPFLVSWKPSLAV
jgi:hypothetical protein